MSRSGRLKRERFMHYYLEKLFLSKILIGILYFFLMTAPVHAQGQNSSISSTQMESLIALELEEIMNLTVTVSSGESNQLTDRQSPGIITVLTRRDIDALGVSHLFELMRFVPGFDWGVNESGIDTFQVRGNYAGEGQVLINYNGVPINEIAYGLADFAGNYSLDHIERIEIIRGPGSALYGGTAELGVINLISRHPQDQFYVGLASNRVGKPTGYVSGAVGAGFGGKAEGEVSGTFHAGFSYRDRTEDSYFGFDGTEFQDASRFNDSKSEYFQIRLRQAALDYQLYYGLNEQNFPLSFYDPIQDDGTYIYDTNIPGTVKYRSLISQFSYKQAISSSVHFNGLLFYGNYDSGRFDDDFTEFYPEWFWDVPTNRIRIQAALNFKPSDMDFLSFDFGYGYEHDNARYSEKMTSVLSDWYGIDQNIGEKNLEKHYVYLQSLAQLGRYTLTTGLRTEKTNNFGSVSVPRIGLTYVNGAFHYKMLGSRAYRSPSIVMLGITPELDAEEAKVYEMELGYILSRHSVAKVNVFSNDLEKVIVYNDTSVEYANQGDVTTEGFELEYRYESNWGFAATSFSRYWVRENTVESYRAKVFDPMTATNLNLDKLLGAAQSKWTLYGKYQLSRHFSINPSLLYLGPRYSIGYIPERGIGDYLELGSDWIVNCFFNFESFKYQGLNVSLGVYNLSDGDNIVTTGYQADGIPHTAGIGRRIDMRVSAPL